MATKHYCFHRLKYIILWGSEVYSQLAAVQTGCQGVRSVCTEVLLQRETDFPLCTLSDADLYQKRRFSRVSVQKTDFVIKTLYQGCIPENQLQP